MRALLLLLTFCFPLLAQAYSNESTASSVRLQGYRPSYFLFGRPDQKLQLSLKARVIDSVNLHVAYTQLMMWDLFRRKSAPFSDVNYNPEIFWRFHFETPGNDEEVKWVDIGYEHESNGRDESASRSWDRLYALFSAESLIGKSNTRLQWGLKAWFPIDRDRYNNDITRYRGYYEANLTLIDLFGGWIDRNDLTLRIYGGGKHGINPLKGGQELTFRVNKWPSNKVLPMLVLQVFHGYGESLAYYNQKRFGLRAGIGF